jgi:nucleoid DNA-binding protein
MAVTSMPHVLILKGVGHALATPASLVMEPLLVQMSMNAISEQIIVMLTATVSILLVLFGVMASSVKPCRSGHVMKAGREME